MTNCSILLPDIVAALRLVFRARYVTVVGYIVLTLIIVVLLAAQFSARHPATVALDVGLSVIRLALPLLAILLVQELFSRDFERKCYLTSFTYPRPRYLWLLGRILAILLVCLGLLSVMGAVLATLSAYVASGYQQTTPITLGTPYLITLAFTSVDLLVTIAIATLLAVATSTPSFVLIGTVGFVLIARSYTPIIELLRNSPQVVSEFTDPRIYQDSLGLLAFLLPDLGRMDVRMIALYDKMVFLPTDWPLLLGATLAYITALLALSVWILNRREFN
jgi:Cu-processing system permease protein